MNAFTEAFFVLACRNGSLKLVKSYVERGVDVQYSENEGILKAVYSGNVDLVKYLLDNGAKLDCHKDIISETAGMININMLNFLQKIM